MPKKPKTSEPPSERILVERVQTGVRLEKRLLKVLKGLAEYHDMTLGDLLEGIVLHAFDGRHPFGDETRQRMRSSSESTTWIWTPTPCIACWKPRIAKPRRCQNKSGAR